MAAITIPGTDGFRPMALEQVNGNPAVVFHDDTANQFKYVRATNASGTAWGTSVEIENSGEAASFLGFDASLAIVNGNPALSYYRGNTNGDIGYVRSSDINGASW